MSLMLSMVKKLRSDIKKIKDLAKRSNPFF